MFSKTIVIYITRPETVILQVRARFVIRGVSRGSTSASNFFLELYFVRTMMLTTAVVLLESINYIFIYFILNLLRKLQQVYFFE
jgi:hypothetical protein